MKMSKHEQRIRAELDEVEDEIRELDLRQTDLEKDRASAGDRKAMLLRLLGEEPESAWAGIENGDEDD